MKAISLALKRKYTEEYFYLSTLPDRKTQVAQIDSVWVREVKCNGILLSANQPVITLRRITKEKIGATTATFFYTFSTGRCLGIMKSWFDYVSTPLVRPALSILMVCEKDYPEILRAKAPAFEAAFASAAIWKLGLFSVAGNRTEQVIDWLAFFQSQKK